jgi:hypothetical protein
VPAKDFSILADAVLTVQHHCRDWAGFEKMLSSHKRHIQSHVYNSTHIEKSAKGKWTPTIIPKTKLKQQQRWRDYQQAFSATPQHKQRYFKPTSNRMRGFCRTSYSGASQRGLYFCILTLVATRTSSK